jgi:hypothetical protein
MRAHGGAMRIGAGTFATALLLTWSSTSANPLRLHIDWPTGWELQQSPQGAAVHFRGREVQHGFVLQELDATVVDIRDAARSPTKAQLEDLAARQRARYGEVQASRLEVFGRDRGYYFSARIDRRMKSSYTHVFEGVLYDAGHLVSFTLHTNAQTVSRAQALLKAIESFEIR